MYIRDMKKNITILLFAICFVSSTTAQAQRNPESKLNWNLGAQAWTFHHFTFFEAIDKIKECGLSYVEAFPGQTIGGGIEGKMDYNMPVAKQKAILKILKEKKVKLISFGVVGADSEEEWKKLFEFAKTMGIKNITSEPNPDHLDIISNLCDQYKINVAIHNHPEPSRYWHPDTVLKLIEGKSKRIGACADIGHWVRSGLDPVECIKKLEGHIVQLHFKDINEQSREAHDVHWGTGVSNVEGVMRALKKQRFKGLFSVEYEYNWDNNVQDVKESVQYFREVVRTL